MDFFSLPSQFKNTSRIYLGTAFSSLKLNGTLQAFSTGRSSFFFNSEHFSSVSSLITVSASFALFSVSGIPIMRRFYHRSSRSSFFSLLDFFFCFFLFSACCENFWFCVHFSNSILCPIRLEHFCSLSSLTLFKCSDNSTFYH